MTSQTKVALPISEKVALLLKHDSLCAVEKTGVCNCWFFDVANNLVSLLSSSRQETLKEVGEIIDVLEKEYELKYKAWCLAPIVGQQKEYPQPKKPDIDDVRLSLKERMK